MSFTSYSFVFLFLPLVAAGVFLCDKLKSSVCKKLFLIALSLVFYAWASPAALLWLLLTAAVSRLFARRIESAGTLTRKKILLGLGVLLLVLSLCFFKYADLAALRARAGDFAALVLVPTGVSFYTFQFVVYLIEVYRGRDRAGEPLNFALYSVFFVYRTMGPIMTHSDFEAQLSEAGALRVTADSLSRGIYQFVLGLFKKLVIADTVAVLANNGFALTEELSFLAAWGTALAYTFQLYFDFSGYSDMAIGIGRMIGLKIPQNFDSPYKSESVSVFWRRWHMTLGRALTTSVYISLGGNRRGLFRTCVNLFCVMAVSGIWHGDTLNFLLWGTAYGLILVFERLCEKPLAKLPLALRRLGTFLVVTLLWVPFRAPTFAGALRIWRGMVNVSSLGAGQFAEIAQDGVIALPAELSAAWGAVQLIACALIVFCCKNSQEKTEKMKFSTATAVWIALLFFFALIHLSRAGVFLYENF